MQVDHSENIIEIRDVTHSYNGQQALTDVNLNIHKGDYVGLIGPNGGGKTTLVRLILGLLPLQKGVITLFGQELCCFNQWSRIGYVAQKATKFDLQFPLTAGEVVNLGHPKKEDAQWALGETGLTKEANTLIGNLSGGQQQRVFIARALAHKPEVLFLDEPTTGVDVQAQAQFYTLLSKLNRELHITLVLVSHDIDVVISEVTEVACINQRLIYHGDPSEFARGNYLKKLYGTEMKFIVHGN